MDMQWRNRELASEDERRRDVERERAGGLDRTDQGAVMVEEPGMTPVGVGIFPVKPPSSAARNSAAVWKRSAGTFDRPRSMTVTSHSGRSCLNCRGGVGGLFSCEWIIAIAVSPENGRCCVSSRYSTTAIE